MGYWYRQELVVLKIIMTESGFIQARERVAGMIRMCLHMCRRQSRVLLVLPPFAGIDRPSLGLHTLQAVARDVDEDVSVLYANILFAYCIGESRYEKLCYAPTPLLLGERCFAEIAYGKSVGAPSVPDGSFRTALDLPELPNDEEFNEVKRLASIFIDALTTELADCQFTVVGASTTFEQTAAAISILNGVKKKSPSTVTIIGGANCEGEMASGIRQLTSSVDTVFSGESEKTFVAFLASLPVADLPAIVVGEPCRDLDSLPTPDFAEYYQQFFAVFGSPNQPLQMWLPYETSRGCWWGQKHHCTFCGINGGGMEFREKTAERVLEELPALLQHHPTRMVLMVDNIMPHRYFSELLPRLAKASLNIDAFYEQKANLTLNKVRLLKSAGFSVIQPGIEALSTHLLKLMDKGVTASQNISLLRYARACEVNVNWNMLYAFPNDLEDDYLKTLELMPLLAHLNPPAGGCHLSIDRFSPYFDRASSYGISNVRPMDAYLDVLPDHVDAHKVAYHFLGDYDTATRRDKSLSKRMDAQIEEWRQAWREAAAPVLRVEYLAADLYLLADTRPQVRATPYFEFITELQARTALVPHRPRELDESVHKWATLSARVAMVIDGELVPLAVCSPELMASFEESRRSRTRLSEIKVQAIAE
jgi:ribosomal peptide maturation radical SAM protein 1